MSKNHKALEIIKAQIQGDTLCHMTDAEKKSYNAEYYRNHKTYWQDYYSKGRTVGRQKHVTDGGGGVHRRGEGLGTGPVGSYGKTNGKLNIPGVQHVSTIGTMPSGSAQNGTMQEWVQSHQTTTSNNVSVNVPGEAFIKKHAKQFVSDIKTGHKAIADAGKQFAKDWISGAKGLFKKKK